MSKRVSVVDSSLKEIATVVSRILRAGESAR